jgi:acetyl esterase
MPLDPQAKQFLDLVAQNPVPPLESLSPVAARVQYQLASVGLQGDPPVPFETIDTELPGAAGMLPVIIYKARATTQETLPVLVFFHGGGYVIGSPQSHDAACRHICLEAECMVISVDYRLAPEHPFPAAVDDAWAVTKWVSANAESLGGDASRLAVGGDSAGANLSAVVCHLARAEGGPRIDFQLLIYPGTDMTCQFPSHKKFGEGYRLTSSLIKWFLDHYLGDSTDRTIPTASPLFAEDFTGLPPALVISAGYDPLQDEDRAYADKLIAAGVDVRYSHYEGMMHGFITMPGLLDKARDALSECAQVLKQAFSR